MTAPLPAAKISEEHPVLTPTGISRRQLPNEGGVVSAFISWVERFAQLSQQPGADVCLLCILPRGHSFLFWLEECLGVSSPEKSFLHPLDVWGKKGIGSMWELCAESLPSTSLIKCQRGGPWELGQ